MQVSMLWNCNYTHISIAEKSCVWDIVHKQSTQFLAILGVKIQSHPKRENSNPLIKTEKNASLCYEFASAGSLLYIP